MNDGEIVRECRELVLREVGTALESVADAETEAFMAALERAETIFCLGVGRVGLAVSAMVKRLNHLGLSAYMVGDLSEPAATDKDLLVIASGSGESAIPVAIAAVAGGKGVPIAYIGSNMNSRVARMAAVKVRIPVGTKLALPDEVPSGQIMSSLFEQSVLLYGDIVALAYSRRKGLDLHALWRRHANLE
ncbi:MAG: sugar isomerase [Planctomycetota bacterium]|jgi:6-phospho-3-hexuloisomerase|nr:sugar isomerase [Planctomycetota bacterium]